ncbi:MAG: hypothetical protein EA360_01825 [Balneolaceae bacterium]|nr:MAG: hypothetical protein EA360_01825 [Balneolaceae bacterium]
MSLPKLLIQFVIRWTGNYRAGKRTIRQPFSLIISLSAGAGSAHRSSFGNLYGESEMKMI